MAQPGARVLSRVVLAQAAQVAGAGESAPVIGHLVVEVAPAGPGAAAGEAAAPVAGTDEAVDVGTGSMGEGPPRPADRIPLRIAAASVSASSAPVRDG